MFAKTLILGSLLVTSSFSITLEALTSKALEQSFELKKYSEDTKALKESEKLSSKWMNPTLGLGVNDILFSSKFKRDIEPMQTQYIMFTQKVPLGDRLDIEELIATNNTYNNMYLNDNYSYKLISTIYLMGYKIVVLEKKIALLKVMLENIESLKSYTKVLYEQKNASYNELIELEISYDETKLKIDSLEFEHKILLQKLKRVTTIDIDSIEVSLDMKYKKVELDIDKHPFIQKIKNDIEKAKNSISLQREKKLDDISVSIGYFNREKFEDYASFSLAIPLAIYDRENINIAKEKYKVSALNNELEDKRLDFDTSIKILDFQMKKAFNNYEIITKKLIKQKMDLENLYNSLNDVKSNTKKIIMNKNSVLALELKAYDELANFYEAYSSMKYFDKDFK